MTRSLNPDRNYVAPDGSNLKLSQVEVLMLVRNVGHLMTNPAILDQNDNEVPEGILDAMFTICIAMHDLNGNSALKNSQGWEHLYREA